MTIEIDNQVSLFCDEFKKVRTEIGKVIVGNEEVIVNSNLHIATRVFVAFNKARMIIV